MVFCKPPCQFRINYQKIAATKLAFMACWLNTALILYQFNLEYHPYIYIFLPEPYSVLTNLCLLTLPSRHTTYILQSICPINQHFKHPLQNITVIILKILLQVGLCAFQHGSGHTDHHFNKATVGIFCSRHNYDKHCANYL